MGRKPTYEELEKRVRELAETLENSKRAEGVFRERETFLQTLMDAFPVGLVVIDAVSRRIEDLNPAVSALFGAHSSHIMGKRCHAFLCPAEENACPVCDLGQDLDRSERIMLRANGTRTPILKSVKKIFIRGREKLLECIVDLTERKQAEEVLRESEEKFRNLVETTSDWIWETGADGRYTYTSPRVRDLLGYEPHEVIGRTPFDFMAPGEAERLADEFALLAANKTAFFNLENINIHRDGRRVILETSGVPRLDPQGNLLGYRGVDRDITKRKRTEEALRESEARFREMADLLPQAVYEADTQGILTYANRYAFQLFGYAGEDLEKGMNVLQMLIPEDRDRAARTLRNLLVGNPPDPDISHQYRGLRKNGASFPVVVYSSSIVHNGSPAGLRGIIVDMTEHEKAEEEREKLHAQLLQAQKMESVGKLAGGVAHDFNNMLGIIIGNAELAAMQLDPDEPLYPSLQEILKASHRSADTVRQLLAFARKQTINPKVLDLNDTVPGMLKMLRRLIGEDIELHWIPGKDVGMVRMDPSQVNQILANLVVNSRDAIPGVGKITIESANAVLDDSYCRAHAGFVPGEYVLLAVSDTGTGMSPEIMEHLFDPFFTTKEMGRGTGLGLATVYGIVKQNNGLINLYSKPGQGTIFKIYLPRFEGEASVTDEKVDERTLPEGTETVLIAEDEAPLLHISRDILERQGYTVLAARRPTEALSLAEKHRGEIHLLLTDVVMPEMNGRELMEKLQVLRPGMKGLFMSGYTANVVVHHGVLDEGVHFIEKPFLPRVLAEKIREVLDKG